MITVESGCIIVLVAQRRLRLNGLLHSDTYIAIDFQRASQSTEQQQQQEWNKCYFTIHT